AKKGHEKGLGQFYFGDFIQNASLCKELVLIPRVPELNSQIEEPNSESKFKLDILKESFPNVYLPLTFYLDGKDSQRVQKILELSKQFSLSTVATNDVEYHIKERKIIQDVLISTREGKTLEQIGFKVRPNGERYIKSAKEMAYLYRDFKGAL